MSAGAFWAAFALIVLGYVLMPAAILVRGRLRRRPHAEADITPTVSIVVAAHNEVASIAPKLDNLAALDYPADRIEVIVASDGSDDGTNEVVAGHPAPNVRLLALERVGKAEALNAAVAVAGNEILVFTDANSMFAPDALRELARPFADPHVGGVAGDQRYLSGAQQDSVAEGEERYWNLDRRLKQAESDAGSVVSATGAIYAIRRALFVEVPAGVTDDFATSTAVIEQGYRLVFSSRAIAWEPVAARGSVEFGRKVRIMTRGLRGVLVRRRLLDPVHHGFYAFQLAWHKLLRRLMAVPLVLLFVAAVLAWPHGALYRLAAVAQGAFYATGAVGLLVSGRIRRRLGPLALPAYFMLVNGAALVALWNLLTGRRIERWDPQRTPSPDERSMTEPAS